MGNKFAAKDLTAGQLNALVKKVGGHDKVIEILSEKTKVVVRPVSSLVSTSKQIVNYNRPLRDWDYCGGFHFEVADSDFEPEEKGQREVEYGMFYFDFEVINEMDDDKLVAMMKTEGFRPATIKELLSYGEKNPKKQLEYPIIGLGSFALVSLVEESEGGCVCRYVGELFCDEDGHKTVYPIEYNNEGRSGLEHHLGVRI